VSPAYWQKLYCSFFLEIEDSLPYAKKKTNKKFNKSILYDKCILKKPIKYKKLALLVSFKSLLEGHNQIDYMRGGATKLLR